MALSFSTLQEEGPYQASKWLSVQVLLDTQEMAALLEALPDLQIFIGAGITAVNEGELSKAAFLELYQDYVETLKRTELPDPARYRAAFSSMWTTTPTALYAVDLGEGRQLIKPRRPLVQVQAHDLGYSTVDETFRPMVAGPNSLSWGLQFSFPQIFQDPQSREIHKVDAAGFENAALFRALQRWLRHHSQPTPVWVNGKKQNLPVRIGKACLDWIAQHPQVQAQELQIGGEHAHIRNPQHWQ